MALKTLNRRNKKDLKWPKIIIAILSTIGIVDTGSITLKNWGLFTSLSCPGIQNGCETVLNSPWGTLFVNNQINIPLSFAGFITYLSILFITIILSLNLISPKEKLNKNALLNSLEKIKFDQKIKLSERNRRALNILLDLKNRQITTITLLKACLFREESRGGHYRDDFPDKDKNWECHTRQQLDQKIQKRFIKN